ncbi:MAG: hypothetical protein AAF627_10370 [Myxococcota bacterium]
MVEKETYPGGQRLTCLEGGYLDEQGISPAGGGMVRTSARSKLEALKGSLVVLEESTALTNWPKELIRRLILMAHDQVQDLEREMDEAAPGYLDYSELQSTYKIGRKLATRLVEEGEIEASVADGRGKRVFLESSVQRYLRRSSTSEKLKSVPTTGPRRKGRR